MSIASVCLDEEGGPRVWPGRHGGPSTGIVAGCPADPLSLQLGHEEGRLDDLRDATTAAVSAVRG